MLESLCVISYYRSFEKVAKYLLYSLAGEKIFIAFLDELGNFGNFGFRKIFGWLGHIGNFKIFQKKFHKIKVKYFSLFDKIKF